LIGGDIHMIISHPHQGTETFQWDVVEEIGRLHDHTGLSFKEQLVCPIFTQNKFIYLELLCQFGMTNPFLRIVLRKIVLYIAKNGKLIIGIKLNIKKLFVFFWN
jgi:hypothetical protein